MGITSWYLEIPLVAFVVLSIGKFLAMAEHTWYAWKHRTRISNDFQNALNGASRRHSADVSLWPVLCRHDKAERVTSG